MNDGLVALAGLTYMVRHNPNCPSPYEIRLPGGALVVQGPEGSFAARNVVGYGKTFDDAAADALRAWTDWEGEKQRKRTNPIFRSVWEGL